MGETQRTAIHAGQSSTVRAAIIGMGTWGQNLVEQRAGQERPDPVRRRRHAHAGRAEEFSRRHGIPLQASFEAVLADPSIDAVVLATPHSMHAEQIVAAARAGKHVFTEKPLGLTAAQSAAAVAGLCRAQGDAGRRLQLALPARAAGDRAHARRRPARQAAAHRRQFLRAQRLPLRPRPLAAGSRRSAGRGHDRPRRACGRCDAVPRGRDRHVYAQSFRLAQDFGVDDTTSMLFRFKSGATGYLGTVIASAETWRMQVFGSKGWAEVGDVEHLTTWQMKVCFIDPANVTVKQKPELMTFDDHQHGARGARAFRARHPGRPAAGGARRRRGAQRRRAGGHRRVGAEQALPFPSQPEETSMTFRPVAVSVLSRQRCCSRAERRPRRRNRRPAIPNKLIRIIVPSPPGGPPDQIARIVAPKLHDRARADR